MLGNLYAFSVYLLPKVHFTPFYNLNYELRLNNELDKGGRSRYLAEHLYDCDVESVQ